MGDTTYMQVTVYDCPTRRKVAARLIAEYLDIGTPEVEPGEQYTVEETSVGNIQYLAANLIAEVPRCSFIGWEDPGYCDGAAVLGELIAYTPKLGRFDGECTAGGDVALDRKQVEAVTAEAVARPYLDRDMLLCQRRGTRSASTLRAWEAMPGLADALDVAYGIPWVRHADGDRISRRDWGAWTKVIDARFEEASRGHDVKLSGLAAQVSRLGLSGHAKVVLESGSDQPGDVLARLDDVRAVADRCRTAIDGLAEPQESTLWGLPYELRRWADHAETVWRGRRRP